LDALTLAIIAAVTARSAYVMGIAGSSAALLALILWAVRRSSRVPPPVLAVIRPLAGSSTVLAAVLLSFAAWVPAALVVMVSAATVGVSVPWTAGMQIFASATLLGGISLMPAGIGTTGSAAIVGLREIGVGAAAAVAVVSVLRLATTGLTLAAGLVVLAVQLKRGRAELPDSVDHFDEIADVYDDQLSPHIRDLLVTRKTESIHRFLSASPVPMVNGLDLGCGQGAHVMALRRRGYRVIGVDPSVRSVVRARRGGVTAAAGSATKLPFSDQAFDFVYAVGVMHHIAGEAARRQAFDEIRRVLKPSGLLLMHETNPRNPIFRFYMGYVFPIVRRIDEGTEEWLDPGDSPVAGMTRIGTEYATFLPDFAPRSLMPTLTTLERQLEDSQWRGYAAHYLAVFRNDATAGELVGMQAGSLGGSPEQDPPYVTYAT
jgi:SAM-dependent methyltransferase